MIKVEISGFKSEEEAKEFIVWYQESGEQDSDVWREEHAPDANWNVENDGLSFKLKNN